MKKFHAELGYVTEESLPMPYEFEIEISDEVLTRIGAIQKLIKDSEDLKIHSIETKAEYSFVGEEPEFEFKTGHEAFSVFQDSFYLEIHTKHTGDIAEYTLTEVEE